jgi:hypothetical protein
LSGENDDDAIEGVIPNKEVSGKEVGKRGESAAGMLAIGKSSEGSIQSSAPSSSASTAVRIFIADCEDELAGSNVWVPRGWVPGMNACILR